MSGTLPKSPSEGDLTSNLVEFPQSLNQNKSSNKNSSFLPLGANKFYLPPDLKKGAFASSNIRIVWKSATFGDLSNLNKVLDLPQAPKRTPSPIPPKIGPTDHVFSEHFDPLAVHKREYVDSSEEEDPDNKSVSSSYYKIVERKRHDTEIVDIDMPSVRDLKSLFEKSKEEKIEVTPHYSRSFKKSKSVLEKYPLTVAVTDEPKKLDTGVKNTDTKIQENKENAKNLPIIINENEKSLSKESSKEKIYLPENNKHEPDKKEAAEVQVKTSSKEVNIEADHIRKVRDLLSIFKSMEPKKGASPTVIDISTEKTITEVKSKSVENVKPVDTDKVRSISNEKPIVKEVPIVGEEVKPKEDSPVMIKPKAKEDSPVIIIPKAKEDSPVIIKPKAKEDSPIMIKPKAKEDSPAIIKPQAKEDSPVMIKPNLHVQDLENKYISEEPIDTSSNSVSDLKRKWETLVIRKKSPNKVIESSYNLLMADETEDIIKIDKYKKASIRKGKMSPEILNQSKIFMEKKENIEKEKITEKKEEKIEDKIESVTEVKQNVEKGKVTIEASVIEKEKEIPNKKEIRKTYSDPVYNTEISQNIIITERNYKFKTSVKDLASIFEFKKVYETKSAPVTPATTNTSKINFDYDIPLSESKKSVQETSNILKPDVPKEYDTNRNESSKEVISISSTTSKLITKEDKKSTSNLQNLKQRFSSESFLSSNLTNTQYNATLSQTKTNVDISDAGPLEKMKRIKSESQFSNKFIVKDAQTTADAKLKDSSKISVQESIIINNETVSKSAVKEVKQKVVESQSSIVQKTEKEVKNQNEPKTSQSSSVQNTVKEDKTPNEQKTSRSVEMSLGSLERQASVTKMKSMYERQSSTSGKEVSQNEIPQKKILHSYSVGSVSTESKYNSSKEKYTTSLSTTVQETKEIREHDAKVENKKKETIISSENEIQIDKTSSIQDKKKTKIEELVESFVKSEGLSNYLEMSSDENISPIKNKESEDFDVLKIKKTTDTFKYQENEEKIETSASETVTKISQKSTSSLSSSKDKKPAEVNNTTLVVRSGSRELRPDELKYFQNMISVNNNQTKKRERSNSIDSSSPTSTLPKNKFSRSKMRSSSRQFRDLHTDELKFFGSKINDRHSKMLLSPGEVTLRQEVLEKSLLASSLEENEREE